MASDSGSMADVVEAVDYLYGLDPGRFVAERDALVKALRAEDRRPLATEVKALRKPSKVAGELNRVLRSEPDRLTALLAAAQDLRSAHTSVLAGDPVDLAELTGTHRRAAAELAADGADPQHLASLLEATSLDPDCHDALRAASFVTEPTPTTGFDLLGPGPGGADATVIPFPRHRAKRRAGAGTDRTETADDPGRAEVAEGGAPPKATTASEPGSRRRRALAKAEAADRRAATSLDVAGRRVEAALAKEARARARLDDLEAKLAAARDHLETTVGEVTAARRGLTRAEQLKAERAEILERARADGADD